MTFSHLIDTSAGPQWQGVLPGAPDAYFLTRGEGEHAMLFDQLFTVLASGSESQGHFGVFTSDAPAGDTIPAHSHAGTHETFFVIEGAVRVFVRRADGTRESRLLGPGDFGFVPAGLAHAYRVEEPSRLIGTATGVFERFFQHMGTATDHATADQPPYIPDLPRMQAAARAHDTTFLPELRWDGAGA